MCLEAVKKDGMILQFVKEQTEEMCLQAVKQDGFYLNDVKEQTDKICLYAVKNDGLSLTYVEKQTSEICLAAVKQNGLALKYVKGQTQEICLAAVKQDGLALEYVKEQTEEICLEAVKQNGVALKFVKEQTKDICLEAIKKSIFAIKYLNNSMYKFYEDILKYYILKSTDNRKIDFSRYCFRIYQDESEIFTLGNIKNDYIKNLKIIDLPFNIIDENGFFDYIVKLNDKFSFIIDDSLKNEVWQKLIFSNNYIISFHNSDNAKYYSKLLDYIMQPDEFSLYSLA